MRCSGSALIAGGESRLLPPVIISTSVQLES